MMPRRLSRSTPLQVLAVWMTLISVRTPLAQAADAKSPRRPNIVIFLVDDMGWRDCGAYGSQYYETPHIDTLAAKGMRFTDAYSANPLCSPTRASILTGKYPARHGITSAVGHQPPTEGGYPASPPANRATIQAESRTFLDPAEYTLAEAFHDAGYATGHFGKWHLGLTEPHWPERQGYDVAWHGKPDAGPSPPNGYFAPYSFKGGTIQPAKDGTYIVDQLTDEACKFMEANRDRPFLLSVWQFGVHGPWGHKEEYTKEFAKKTDPSGLQGNPVMASMLRSVDESVGRITAKLTDLGIADDTIFLFTSDNGGNVHSNVADDRTTADIGPGHPRWPTIEQYRKYAGFQAPTNNAPLRAGKGTLYEGGVRIPLIVSWPGHVPAGVQSSAVVGSYDFYPTLIDLLGIARRDGVVFDGLSFAKVLRDPAAALDRPAVFNYFPHGGPAKPPGVTVRKGNLKLIRWFETGPEQPSKHELYDLAADLGETKNLAAERPETVQELDALIDRFLKETSARAPLPNPAFRKRAAGDVKGRSS